MLLFKKYSMLIRFFLNPLKCSKMLKIGTKSLKIANGCRAPPHTQGSAPHPDIALYQIWNMSLLAINGRSGRETKTKTKTR